jgi:hypothetical protein
MAKAAKKSKAPRPSVEDGDYEFSGPDWLPLDVAFVHIRNAVGSPALAARDLHGHLLSGRLPSACRRIHYSDGKEDHAELSPDFWQRLALSDTAGDDSRVALWPGESYTATADYYFFVRRADFEILYPPAGAAPDAPLKTKDWLMHEVEQREKLGDIPERITDFADQLHRQMVKGARAGSVERVIAPRSIEGWLRKLTTHFPPKKRR